MHPPRAIVAEWSPDRREIARSRTKSLGLVTAARRRCDDMREKTAA
jgi:hypothetical protein